MSSPDGQVSEMAKNGGVGGGGGLGRFGISSTSTRATARHPGRTPGRIGWRTGVMGAPGVARGRGFARSRRCRTGPLWSRNWPVSGGVAHQVAGPPVSDYLSDDPPGNRCTSPDCTGRNPERSAR